MNPINKKCRINVDCNALLTCATFDVAMASKPITPDNWSRFGRWVFEKREALGMRQEDLGEKIGKDRQTVYRIEKGGSTKRATVIKIANALGQSTKTALDIAFGIPSDNSGPLKPAPVETETIEETLRMAFFFGGKGLSDEEIEKLKPYMEMLDREIDRLAEMKKQNEALNK